MIKNLKNLVNKINKLGAAPTADPNAKPVEQPVSATTAVPVAAPTAPVSPGAPTAAVPAAVPPAATIPPKPIVPNIVQQTYPSVSEMQKAIYDLATDVISDSISSTMAPKPRDTQGAPAAPEAQSSKESFNNFIAEQYMGSLPNNRKGKEWDLNIDKTSYSDKKKNETDIYELYSVMDSLRRVGSPKQEFLPDGQWEFRTNNALMNLLGFAHALISLEGDFGLRNPKFGINDLKRFEQIMDGLYVPSSGPGRATLFSKSKNGTLTKISDSEKQQKASELTEIISKIKELYDDFRNQITAHSQYRNVIEGRSTFDTYNTKGNKDKLSSVEKQRIELESAKDMQKSLKVRNVKYISPDMEKPSLDYIPIKALTNKDEYLKWMKLCGNSEDTATKILKLIKMQLEKSQGIAK